MFFCKICETYKKIFFYRTAPAAASKFLKIQNWNDLIWYQAKIRWSQSWIEWSSVITDFSWSVKLSSIVKPPAFCWNSLVFVNMEKVTTSPNPALKALVIFSDSKRKFYIRNQKKLKLAMDPDFSSFRWKVEKTHCHFLQQHFFLFRENVQSHIPLGSNFPKVPDL